jgi:hypothetical protein
MLQAPLAYTPRLQIATAEVTSFEPLANNSDSTVCEVDVRQG